MTDSNESEMDTPFPFSEDTIVPEPILQNDMEVDFIHPSRDQIVTFDLNQIFDRLDDIFDEPVAVMRDLYMFRTYVNIMLYRYERKFEESYQAFEKVEAKLIKKFSYKSDKNPMFQEDGGVKHTNKTIKAWVRSENEWHETRQKKVNYETYRDLLENLKFLMYELCDFAKFICEQQGVARSMIQKELDELEDEVSLDDFKERLERANGYFEKRENSDVESEF